MPSDMKLVMDVTNAQTLATMKDNPFKIKEGVPYKCVFCIVSVR